MGELNIFFFKEASIITEEIEHILVKFEHLTKNIEFKKDMDERVKETKYHLETAKWIIEYLEDQETI